MAMFIGLGISGHAAPAGTVTPPIVGALAQVAPMPVDSAVFDSGAARGANAADIPLSGTTDAADGTPIEARIVRADTGTQVHPWATIATASGGAWSGMVSAVPRSPHWLKAQVRVQGSAAVAQTGNSFAVGHVWSVWAQSVASRLLLGVAQPYVADEPLAAEGNLQIWSIPRSGTAPSTQAPVVRLVTSAAAAADEVTPGAVVMANAMQAARPGEKFAIIAHTVSGTSPVKMITPVEDFATPGDKGRFWEDEVALHTAATAHGTQVGAVFNHSWDGFDISSFNARRFVPIMTQKNVDGTPLTLGDTVLADNPAQSFVLHHSMTELYDYSYTKIGFIDGKGDRIGPASNVFSYATLAEVPTNWESVAPLWRQVSADDVNFPEFLDYQGPVMGHVNGISDGAGGWQDTSHASIQDEYGIPYYGGIVANLMMRATGLIAFDDPVITNSDWTPTHIDLWNPSYDITTNRTLDGGTSPFVRGFFFDGLAITTEAQLLPNAGGSGRQGIRITPAGGVDGSEILQYGRGGSPGLLTSPQDYFDRYVLDLPVMDVGQAGIAALPAVMQTTLDSNLVGLPFFEKAAGVSGSAYVDPDDFGTASGFTLKTDIRVTTSGKISAGDGAGSWTFESLSGGQLRISITNFISPQVTTAVVVSPDAFVELVWTFDLIAKTTTLWWGDDQMETFALADGGTTIATTTRNIVLLANALGADVRYIECWKAATATRDTTALGAAHKRIAAGADGNPVQIPLLPSW